MADPSVASPASHPASHSAGLAVDTSLAVDEDIVATLRDQLPAVSELTIAAVIAEVPSYTDALNGSMGDNITGAVQLALASFLQLLGAGRDTDAGTPLQPALDGAYALGRGEARSGRTMDALLAAYRVGARVAWREMSASAVAGALDTAKLARFAELVFAYIDELSAASVAGHSDELATTGRVRERYLERLARDLVDGASEDALLAAAQRADWEPPATLTAVVLPARQARTAIAGLDPRTLEISPESNPADSSTELTSLLVPSESADRGYLMRHLSGRGAVVGPSRPWTQVGSSHRRALRVAALIGDSLNTAVDSDDHLAALVCTADADALADLRSRVLQPLAGLKSSTGDRLTETLRSWLLHQGRRDEIATELVVHPQTVRYRMTQLRQLYGDKLADPQWIAELTIALAIG